MREIDQTWTVHTLAQHCGVSDTTVKRVITLKQIPVYQKIGTYKLYDHRLLNAVRAYVAERNSPEFQEQERKRKQALLVEARETRKKNITARRAAKAEVKRMVDEANAARVPEFDLDTLVRIERKLDTILKELNVKFEG